MERTERYDPEDLEQMMLERGFDELLEEERAFALRHLESRAEYERMRALLHHMHLHAPPPPAMDASAKIRVHVLEAFRAQQQPRWRIWLNSIGGFLAPPRPALYWRPALALATVALLFIAIHQAYSPNGTKERAQLAEAKRAVPAAPASAHGAEAQKATTSQATDVAQESLSETTIAAQQPLHAANNPVAPAQSQSPLPAVDAPTPPTEMLVTTAENRTVEDKATADLTKEERRTTTRNESAEATLLDLAEEQTTASKKDTVARKRSGFAAKQADERAAYTEDDLLGLLRAAW